MSARVSEQEVRQLAIEFRQWRRRQGVTTGLVYAERRVKLFVLYLARGGYYHQCGRSEGLSLTASAVYLHQVAAFFAETADQYVFKTLKFAFNVIPRPTFEDKSEVHELLIAAKMYDLEWSLCEGHCSLYAAKTAKYSGAEFAGPKNDGPKKIKDWKMQDLKMTDQITGLENARPGK